LINSTTNRRSPDTAHPGKASRSAHVTPHHGPREVTAAAAPAYVIWLTIMGTSFLRDRS
jgi:hypothetical protein